MSSPLPEDLKDFEDILERASRCSAESDSDLDSEDYTVAEEARDSASIRLHTPIKEQGVRSLQNQFNSVERKLNSLIKNRSNEDVERLKDDVVRIKFALAEKEAEANVYDDQIETLRADKHQLEEELTYQRAELAEISARIDGKNKYLEDLLTKTKVHLAETAMDKEEFADRMAALEAQVRAQTELLQLRNEEIEILRKSRPNLKDSTLVKELVKANKDKEGLSSRCTDLEAQLLRVRNELALLTNDYNAVVTEYKRQRRTSM